MSLYDPALDDLAEDDLATNDLTQLDSKLRATFDVERNWEAPELPDEVRLDLAKVPDIPDANEMSGFLFGLQADLKETSRQQLAGLDSYSVFNQYMAEGQYLDRVQQGQVQRPEDFGQLYLPNDSAWNDVREGAAAVLGKQAPRVANRAATKNWKREAFRRGLIPEQDMDGGAWSPERYRATNYEMLRQDVNSRIAGNRFAAMSTAGTPDGRQGGMLDLIDKWLSPTGLLSAAVAMDFLPDPGAIKREWEDWGTKWRRFAANPTSPRDLIDAVTGPIDDVAFPIINTALLFSGFGQTFQFARGLRYVGMADDIPRAFQAGEALWEGSRFGTAASKVLGFTKMDVAAESAMMARESMLAGGLRRAGFSLVPDAMTKWRGFHSVQTLKKGVQAGMRVGLAGNLENLVLPDREGGIGLVEGAGTDEAIDRVRLTPYEKAWTLPLVSVAEYAFQPSRIFMPGTIRGLAAPVGDTVERVGDLRRFGGDLFRNADGELRGGLGQRLDYVRGRADEAAYREAATLRNKGQITSAVTEWWQWKLNGPSQQAYRQLAQKDPHRASLAAVLSIDDPDELTALGRLSDKELAALDEEAGRKLTYLMASAAVDHSARARLMEVSGFNPWDAPDAYLALRRQFAHQITNSQVDLPGTIQDYERLLDQVSSADRGVARAAREELATFEREFRRYAEELVGDDWLTAAPSATKRSPALAGDELDEFATPGEMFDRSHAQSRRERVDEIVAQFFEPTTRSDAFARLDAHTGSWREKATTAWAEMLETLDPTILPTYMDDIMAADGVDALRNWGRFEEAHELVQTLREGDLYRLKPTDVIDNSVVGGKEAWVDGLSAELQRIDLPPEAIRKSVINQYKGAVDMTGSRITLGRLGKPRKQHADLLEALSGQVVRMRQWLGGGGDLIDRVPDVRRAIEDWDSANIGQEAGGIAEWGKGTVRRFLASPEAQAIGLSNSSPESRRFVRALRWMARSGGDWDDPMGWLRQVERDILDSDLLAELGVSSRTRLEDLGGQLRKRRLYLGSVVEVQDRPHVEAVRGQLAEMGYEPVAGRFFLNPSDLMGRDSPLAPLTRHQVRANTLSSFLSKHSESEKLGVRMAKLRGLLPEALDGVDVYGDGTRMTRANVEDLLDRLDDEVRRSHEMLEDTVVGDRGLIARTFDRARLGRAPRNMWDTHILTEKRIADLLGVTMPAAKRIRGSIIKARSIGYEYQGLAELENKVVEQPVLRRALGLFDKGPADDLVAKRNFVKRWTSGRQPNLKSIHSYRDARAATGAALGAAAGYAANEQQDNGLEGWQAALVGAAVGGGAASMGKWNPFTARGLVRATAGVAGAQAGAAVWGDRGGDPEDAQWAAIAGGALGALGAGPAFRAASKGYSKLADALDWRDYSRLGSWAFGMRDYLRFNLNPWFDAQRYSEALIMGATRQFPDDVRIPLNYSPRATRKMIDSGKLDLGRLARAAEVPGLPQNGVEVEKVMGRLLREATGGRIDVDTIDVATRQFTDEGIMGFSNHRWMTSAFTHLVNGGLDPATAADHVQDLYSYGKAGRSGAELSVNFVFFPFSFMKKFYGQVGNFLTDDLSRAMVLHDSLKAYEWLSERYDLQEKLESHLPVMQQLRVLNPLSYGLSPGEFGGINRPLLEGMYYTPWVGDEARDVANFFLPQALKLQDPEDAEQVKRMLYRMVPAYRNVQRLVQDGIEEQVNVGKRAVTMPGKPGTWISRSAEVDRGISELETLRRSLDKQSEVLGLKPRAVLAAQESDTGFGNQVKLDLKRKYRAAEAEILSRYPAMMAERSKWAAQRIERNEDMKRLLGTADPSELSPAEQGAYQFNLMVQEFERQMEDSGLEPGVDNTFTDDELDKVRSVAIALTRRYPGFAGMYDLYWAPEYGPITEALR